MAKIYLSLGSNFGDRKRNIEDAISLLEKEAGRILKISKVYETQPFGRLTAGQPWFLNCALKLETRLQPEELLRICQKIEKKLGRTGKGKLKPRTVDLDILFYDSAVISAKRLQLPHPAMQKRRFVLLPLAKIAPRFPHPILRKTVAELLKNCGDKSIVVELSTRPSRSEANNYCA